MSILEKLRKKVSPAGEALIRTLVRWNVSPDWVTYVGLILTVGVAALAALGEIRWAGVAYIFAALCDTLDGTLARASGKGSRFGAFIDSTLDRFEESFVFLGLTLYYARSGGQVEIPLILVVTVGSLMVSYTRARAEGLGVACKVGFMGRPVRVVVMIAGMILDQVLIALIILAITTLATSFQRIYHVWRVTGGEAGGWKPVKEAYILPMSPTPKSSQSEEVGNTP